jgi:hypothetical protein
VIHHIGAIIAGWFTMAALIIIQHLLWKDTTRQTRYLLGAGALCASCTVAGIIADNALLAIAPWAIASAGLIILTIYWFEGKAEAAKRDAQKSGEIIGTAKGLRSELMKDYDGQSDMDKTRFRN